ncbi:hypothetical protein PINS_up018139 [Pythium insidiosum]|nr:hypothetical protein PINS_up018139 [Pythium insidiosum]
MGQYKLNSLGSPLQINVKTMDEYPDEVQKEKFCSCGTNSTDCYRPQDGRLRSCAGVCGSVCAVDANDKRKYTEACYGAVRESDNSGKTVDIMDPKWKPFMDFMASNLTESNYDVLNYFLAMFGGVAAIALMLGFMYAICHRRKYAAASSSQLTGDDNRRVGFAPERRLSFVDSFMTKTLTRWGLFVATGKGTYIVLLTALAFAILWHGRTFSRRSRNGSGEVVGCRNESSVQGARSIWRALHAFLSHRTACDDSEGRRKYQSTRVPSRSDPYPARHREACAWTSGRQIP